MPLQDLLSDRDWLKSHHLDEDMPDEDEEAAGGSQAAEVKEGKSAEKKKGPRKKPGPKPGSTRGQSETLAEIDSCTLRSP